MEEQSHQYKFDINGFLVEDDQDRCSGCKDLQTNRLENAFLSTSDESKHTAEPQMHFTDKWIELLNAENLKKDNKGTFDYEVRKAELNIELAGIGWNVDDQRLESLINRIDLEMKKYDRETTPAHINTMVQVLKDVDRTFPSHKMFLLSTDKKIQLFRILVLYARMNQAVGYCQGMAYVAALLLMYVDSEEDVFWSFTYLLNNQLNHFYDSDLRRVKVLAEVVRVLVNEHYPKLGSLLESAKVHPLMYTTQWFMGMFTGLNCWNSVLFIAQLLFEQGVHSLINVALVILKSCEKTILTMSKLEEILPFLQNIPADFIHRNCLESLMNDNSPNLLKNIDEVEVIMKKAEKMVDQEDKELEERKNNYISRSTRKRQREESDDNMPSKKKTAISERKRSRYLVTPNHKYLTRSSIKTASIKKTALDSVRKGRAELCFTKDAGLIYTSPNTMELKELPNNKENLLAVKLSFDTLNYDHSNELHDCT